MEIDMFKKTLCTVMAALLLVAAGCSAAPSGATGDGYTFTDDLGREVTVRSTERTAALLGSFADMWYLAGGTVCATADDAWDDLNLPLADDVINLGMTKSVSLE